MPGLISNWPGYFLPVLMTVTDVIFHSLPACYLIVHADLPQFTILDCTDAYLLAAQRDRSIIGKPLFEVFPDNPEDPGRDGVQNLRRAIDTVIRTGEKQYLPLQRYDIQPAAGLPFEVRYWKVTIIPVPDAAGAVQSIVHQIEDVTRELHVRNFLKKRYNELERQISDAVSTTQETERLLIGQEIHDNVIQVLNTARLYLERIRPADEKLQTGLELVRQAINDLRDLSQAMRDKSDIELPIADSIHRILNHAATLAEVTVDREIDLPNEGDMPAALRMGVVRIFQELVSNVIQHAQARKLTVSLTGNHEFIRIRVHDDGNSFDPEQEYDGQGWKNIRGRVDHFGGTMRVVSHPDDGTEVNIHLPMLQ